MNDSRIDYGCHVAEQAKIIFFWTSKIEIYYYKKDSSSAQGIQIRTSKVYKVTTN